MGLDRSICQQSWSRCSDYLCLGLGLHSMTWFRHWLTINILAPGTTITVTKDFACYWLVNGVLFTCCSLKPLEDKYRQMHGTVDKQVDVSANTDTDTGGINIDDAKRRLQQEDSIDKKLYRDRIQQKHRVCLYYSINMYISTSMLSYNVCFYCVPESSYYPKNVNRCLLSMRFSYLSQYLLVNDHHH